jgi:hypothetical protein
VKYRRSLAILLVAGTLAITSVPKADEQAATAPSLLPALQGVRSLICPQTTYQAAIAGSQSLQALAARAMLSRTNDPSCGQHDPTTEEGRERFRYLSNTGTNPGGRFFDAMCPQGRHLWLEQASGAMTQWQPCKAANTAAVSTVTSTIPANNCPGDYYENFANRGLERRGWHMVTVPARPGCAQHRIWCPDDLTAWSYWGHSGEPVPKICELEKAGGSQ